MPSAQIETQPLIGLTGVIVGVYSAILATSVWGSMVYGVGSIATYFGLASAATVILTHLEQDVAHGLIGNATSEYLLQCDSMTGNCNVRASYVGTAPRSAKVWELPSSVGQLLGMSCTFWSLYLLRNVAKANKASGQPAGDVSYGDGFRMLGIWMICITVVGYSVYNRFISPTQASVGMTIGTFIGIGAYWGIAKLGVIDDPLDDED